MNRLSDGRNLSLCSESSSTNEFLRENRPCQTAVKKPKSSVKFPPLQIDFEQEFIKLLKEEEKALSTESISHAVGTNESDKDEIDNLEEIDKNDSTPTNSNEAMPSQKLIMQTPVKHKFLQTVTEVDDETLATFKEDVKCYRKYPNCTPGLLISKSQSHSQKFVTPCGSRIMHENKFHTPANFTNKFPPTITTPGNVLQENLKFQNCHSQKFVTPCGSHIVHENKFHTPANFTSKVPPTTPGNLLQENLKFQNCQSLQKTSCQGGNATKSKIQCSIDVSSYMKPQVNKMLFSSARKPLKTTSQTESRNEDIVSSILPTGSPQFQDIFKTITVNNLTYVVLNQIGRGGSSIVYHCYEPKSKMECAIKCVNLNRDKSQVKAFINEVKTLQRLQNCDRIIKMHGYEKQEEEKKLFVVLEKGSKDLAFILKELPPSKKLPLYLLIYYWMEMLYAVKQIHMNGVIHSDLKPANFLEAGGRIKLIDFGIASCVQNDETSVVKFDTIGTFDYISPEAIFNEKSTNCSSPNYGKAKYKISYKSDVWSLGCILYRLIYRRTPFQHIGNTLAKLTMIVDPNHKIEFPEVDWVPPKIIETLRDCLQYNVKSRPSVEDLIKQYENMYY